MKKFAIYILTVGIICSVLFKIYQYDNRTEGNWTHILSSDINGYYMYLPAIFIYKDLQYTFLDNEKLKNLYKGFGDGTMYEGRLNEQGHRYNKYFIGTSILQTPFFLMAWIYTNFSEHPSDGYSIPFQLSVFFSNLFYFLLGLYFLRNLLMGFGFSAFAIYLTLTGVVFATNVVLYVSSTPGLSHIYDFFTVSVFFRQIQLFMRNGSIRNFYLASVLLALTVLIRPTSIIFVLAIPAFSTGLTNFRERIMFLKDRPGKVIISILIFVLILSPQLMIYQIQFGRPFAWSYPEEGFNFLDPQFFNVLFGFRKGFFIYTPFMLFSMIGLVFMYFSNKFRTVVLFTTFILFTYCISSWWDWSYGGSFGMRTMIDIYPMLAIPLGFLFNYSQRIIVKCSWGLVVIIFSSFNLFQCWQYANNIIAYDHMNYEKYRQVFLETDKVFRYSTSKPQNHIEHATVFYKRIYSCDLGTVCQYPFMPYSFGILSYDENKKDFHAAVNDINHFGGSVLIESDSLDPLTKHLILIYKARVKIHKLSTRAAVVLSVKHRPDQWRSYNIVNEVRQTGEWTDFYCQFSLPRKRKDTNDIELYIYQLEADPVFFKSVEVGIYGTALWPK